MIMKKLHTALRRTLLLAVMIVFATMTLYAYYAPIVSAANVDDPLSSGTGGTWSDQAPGIGTSAYQRLNQSEFYNVCSGGSSSGSSSDSAGGDISKVYILGDSITHGARSLYEAKFKGAGSTEVKINAAGGRNFDGPGTTGDVGTGYDAIDKDKDTIKNATTVIIAIGTNQMENISWDQTEAGYIQQTEAAIKKAVDKIKATETKAKLYWVDVAISDKGPSQYVTFAPWIDKGIYGSSQTGGYTVIPWTKEVDKSYDGAKATGPVKDSENLLSDGIHPGTSGQEKLVDKVLSTVKGGGSSSTGSVQTVANTDSSTASSASQCCGTTEASSQTAISGDGKGCGSKTDGNANKKQAWNWLRSKGLTDAAAAGILGNAEQESSFLPQATNSIGCRGFVQWCFGRNTGLDTFAKEHGNGRPWDCLELQLEYMWHEMEEGSAIGRSDGASLPKGTKLQDILNGKDFDKKSQYTGSGPARAAKIFHDYFERSNTATGEDKGRPERAEKLYTELTGKQPPADLEKGGAVSGSSAENVSSGGSCGETSSGGGIMSADCKALVAKYEELRKDKNKLVETEPDPISNDLKNCKEGDHECNGGVNPYLLRAVIAAIENSGADALEVWNMNTRHPCDGLNHPKGRASDLYCFDNNSRNQSGYSKLNNGKGPSKEKCNRIFKYLYDHYDELGLVELIWNAPTDFSKPGDGKQLYVDGHHDHIHIGVSGKEGSKGKVTNL